MDAAEGDPYICTRVVNSAGWPLQGINVTAVRTAINNPGRTFSATTDEDGFVKLQVVRSTYVILASDDEAPTSPLRNGAVYLPTQYSDADQFFDLPGTGGTTPDACGEGFEGIVLTGPGAAPGTFVMNAPEPQGYLEVKVVDQAAAGWPPLPGASIVSATLHDDNSAGSVLTNASGIARFGCIQNAPNNITVTKENFLPVFNSTLTSQLISRCQPDVAFVMVIKMWRTPIHVEYTLSDRTNIVEGATGNSATAGSPPETRVQGAWVNVTDRAATLAKDPDTCPPRTPTPVANGATLDARTPAVRSDFNSTGNGTMTPYICYAQTDSAGRATLILPWSEDGAGAYELTATMPGYKDYVESKEITAAWLQPGHPETVAPRLHLDAAVFERVNITRTFTVRDLQGLPLAGANVSFSQAGELKAANDTGDDGTVDLELQTGPYDVRIDREGNATRTCSATVLADGNVVTGPVAELCFTLVPEARTGVIGIVRDDKTSEPIPDLIVCAGSETPVHCDRTDASGRYQIDVLANTPLSTVRLANQDGALSLRQDWWGFTASVTGNSGAASNIVDSGARNANRTRVPTTIEVLNSADEPLPFANITLRRGAAAIFDTASDRDKTDATGKVLLRCGGATTLCETVWTSMEGKPQFDLADVYVASAMKHKKAPAEGNGALYEYKSTAAFHIPAGIASFTQTIKLDPETGEFQVGVIPRDAHTNAIATTAVVEARAANPNEFAAGPTNIITGAGDLHLYPGAGPYTVCAVPTDRYANTGDEALMCFNGLTQETIPEGGAITLPVNRTRVNVQFAGIDAHTGLGLQRYVAQVVAKPGFTCNPRPDGTTFACDTRISQATGTISAPFALPWTENNDDLCLAGIADSYTVLAAAQGATAGPATVGPGENVTFSATKFCQPLLPGVGGSTPTYVINIRALRTASPIQVNGTVKLPDGAPAVGAIVEVAPERAGLTCEPAEHNATATVPMCRATIAEDGRFSINVPTVFADDTWAVTASLAGHYDETYSMWANVSGLAGDFVLWPREFDAVVRVIDSVPQGTAHLCGSDAFEVRATLKDLQDGDPNPQNPTPGYERTAEPQLDTTCLAVFRITDWHRDPQPVPVMANQPWPVTSAPFLVSSDYENHFGQVFAMLGPRDADRVVTVHMVDGNPTGQTGDFSITGRVFDADAIPTTSGSLGVAARVGARLLTAPCEAAEGAVVGGNVIAGSNGAYTLTLPCAGTYRVTVLPMVSSHWVQASFDVTLTAEAASATQDVAVERTDSSLTVTSFRVPNGPAAGVFVDPTGRDVSADPPARQTRTGGQYTYANLPWGIYTITGNLGTTPLVKYVQPGTDSAPVFSP